jgi:hypothetical protein
MAPRNDRSLIGVEMLARWLVGRVDPVTINQVMVYVLEGNDIALVREWIAELPPFEFPYRHFKQLTPSPRARWN